MTSSTPLAADQIVELMRPLLPEAKHITPYLERIDKNRWYSNFGPMEREFQQRLATHFNLTPADVVTCSSATAGMISVLRALHRPKGSLCIMPSWTFVATPASAIAAEMTPYFMDVDDKTWALDPEKVKEEVKRIKGVIGAVIVVAPYGKAVDLDAWAKFSAETSIPVAVDAAAGFDAFTQARFNHIPVVVSLHATKVMGIGEGGFIVTRDHGLARHVQEQTNFGFYTRHISTPGINSKMSEYAAAVGLAALDVWPEHRQRWVTVIDKYLAAFQPLAERHGLTLWMEKGTVISTFSFRLPYAKADEVISQLQSRGIKARQWWDKGCHRQPAYGGVAHTELTVTHAIGDSLVSIPFYQDIPDHHIDYMARHLDDILNTQG